LEPLMHPHFNPYATENWNQTMEKSGIGWTTGSDPVQPQGINARFQVSCGCCND
jgi:hypothetical protein